jgi:glycerol uptake facilitator-like aquaporin
MLVAEFLGTATLATVAINISRSQIGIGYFVAIGVGLALGLLVLALGPTSGGHFNPAVTIGMWTLRKIQTVQAIAYLAMQMLGGLAAWQLANYFVGSEIQNIAGKSFSWKLLVAEAVGTFVFTFGIAAAVYRRYEGAKAAMLIGGSLFMGTIVASLASNAVLNPAIALANQSWGRAYIFGPIIGGVVGVNLYALLFADKVTVPGSSVSAVKVADAAPASTSRATATRKPAAKKKAAPRKRK